ncbi:RNA methyltransferase [Clostridiales bacterium]|nr:RNA methyltransferase [Clostridiales bacterium]
MFDRLFFSQDNMNKIISKENQIYKLCSKLTARKYRDACGKYLIEGDRLIIEALKTGQKLDTVIVAEGKTPPVDLPCRAVSMEEKLFEKLSQTQASQGILAIVEKKVMEEEDFLRRIQTKSGNVVLLDRLQDPGNIGTILRTADAAGYSGLMTIKGTADLYAPKIVRAAAGSLFRIPVFAADCAEQAVSILKAAGKTILATGFDTKLCYYDIDMRQNIGLIIGNEGNGISAELMDMAHQVIRIPMDGNIDSLNAAVAAGILMYESVRK